MEASFHLKRAIGPAAARQIGPQNRLRNPRLAPKAGFANACAALQSSYRLLPNGLQQALVRCVYMVLVVKEWI